MALTCGWFNTEHLTINFNGTLSSHFSHPPGSPCVDFFSGPEYLSYLAVGVNPPWDSNPFFFELYHEAENEGIYTNDTVYNLDFYTATYVCYQPNGETCSFVDTWPYYFVPVESVNLHLTTIERANIGNQIGYVVTGDETSWVSNNSTSGGCLFDYQTPGNYSVEDNCAIEQRFEWYGIICVTRYAMRI